jgi:hypothetical protein
MPNVFKFADWITMESLRILLNDLHITGMMNTDYNKEFTKEFAVGDTVRVKLPQRFTIRDGIGYTPQALDRQHTTVTVDQLFGIDFDWDSVEQALKMERGDAAIRREYLEPAMSQIAQEIDSRGALWAHENTPNVAGALGTTPTSMTTYLAARQRLKELACPPGDKSMIVSPGMMNTIVANNLTTFNPQNEITKGFKEGYFGRAAGFDWYESMSLYAHTAGTAVTSLEVDGAQSGSSILVSGTTGQTIKKGDTITFAGVFAVNPKTRRSIGSLKHFIVTADVTIAASAGTIPIYPAIIPTGQYQNVTAEAGGSAAITLWPGTSSPSGKAGVVGLALHRDAFACVGVKLANPKAVEIASQARDPKTGISVSFVRQFDVQDRRMKNRFDVLLGFGNLYADSCAVRVASLI